MKYGTILARIGGGLIDLIIVLLISAIILFCWGLLIGLGGKEAYLSEEMQVELWKGWHSPKPVDTFHSAV